MFRDGDRLFHSFRPQSSQVCGLLQTTTKSEVVPIPHFLRGGAHFHFNRWCCGFLSKKTRTSESLSAAGVGLSESKSISIGAWSKTVTASFDDCGSPTTSSIDPNSSSSTPLSRSYKLLSIAAIVGWWGRCFLKLENIIACSAPETSFQPFTLSKDGIRRTKLDLRIPHKVACRSCVAIYWARILFWINSDLLNMRIMVKAFCPSLTDILSR